MKTIPPLTPEQEARFWSYVDKSGDCWIWTGGQLKYGYGVYAINREPFKAHRVAWLLVRGESPDGILCHRCPDGDNPSCVNPDHLYVGTHADNARDRVLAGTIIPHPGEMNPQAKLTNKSVRALRLAYMASPSPDTIKAIARQHGVSPKTIRHTISGRTWMNPEAIPEGFAPMVARGADRTHCMNGHPVTPETTYVNHRGAVVCRICERLSHSRAA